VAAAARARVRVATIRTNLSLLPPTAPMVEFLRRATADQAAADRFAQGFNADPCVHGGRLCRLHGDRLTHNHPLAVGVGRWLWFLPAFIYGSVLLHETAHAMTTKHFGREVIGIGFGWFWLGPVFYVDTSDMWLATRRVRVLVNLAGAALDLTIAGICALMALAASPPVATVAFAMAAALYLIVLANMSPLLEYDGYYALTDLVGPPNLRRHSLAHFFGALRQRPLAWRELGRDKVASAYAVGSLIHLAFLLTMNAWFNHAFFGGLFRNASGWWPGVLTWLVTLALPLIFLLGLAADVRRLVRPPSPLHNRR
jgi:hypothetical protein